MEIVRRDRVRLIRHLLVLAIHLRVTVAKLIRPGAVAAESSLLKHPLVISNRYRQRAPNLTSLDRVVLGLATFLLLSRMA